MGDRQVGAQARLMPQAIPRAMVGASLVGRVVAVGDRASSGRDVRRRRRRVGPARHHRAGRLDRHDCARSLRAELVPDLRADARVPRAFVDAGMESGLFVPLHAADETFGVLGVMTAHGREPLQPHDADLLQAFGVHAAASFAHARARHDAEQLHLVSDRERIARDLHDTVIQRLFAVGLSLEATGRRPAPETQERIHQAVADIDDTIRSIRSSIFSLEARAEEQARLRGRVLEVVAEAAPALGFEPSVRFEGPVDTLANQRDHRQPRRGAARGALERRAARRAATSANVTISAGDEIVLVVDDDGVGCRRRSSARAGTA